MTVSISSPGSHKLLLWFLLALFSSANAQAFRVVIDAGHGGHARGATNDSVYEKHLALDVAFRLERYLKKRGVRSTLTRRSDYFVSLDSRAAMAKLGNAFVSIHFNAASNRGATGIETFYYTSQSAYLAALVNYNVVHKLRGKNRGVKHRGFRVIRNSPCPAILVEGGFLSNNSECRKCIKASYRQKLAEAIGYALIRYKSQRR